MTFTAATKNAEPSLALIHVGQQVGSTIRYFTTKTKLNWKQNFFFLVLLMQIAHSLQPSPWEWFPGMVTTSPPQSLPTPSLLCMTLLSLVTEWMKTLS